MTLNGLNLNDIDREKFDSFVNETINSEGMFYHESDIISALEFVFSGEINHMKELIEIRGDISFPYHELVRPTIVAIEEEYVSLITDETGRIHDTINSEPAEVFGAISAIFLELLGEIQSYESDISREVEFVAPYTADIVEFYDSEISVCDNAVNTLYGGYRHMVAELDLQSVDEIKAQAGYCGLRIELDTVESEIKDSITENVELVANIYADTDELFSDLIESGDIYMFVNE